MRNGTGASIENRRPSRPFFSCFWRKGDVENITKSDIGNEKGMVPKFNSLQHNQYHTLSHTTKLVYCIKNFSLEIASLIPPAHYTFKIKSTRWKER